MRILAIIFLFSLFFAANCKQENPKPRTMEKNITYLALGDSYTIGQSVSINERYPVLLAEEFKKENITTSPEIIATTGWTTANLQQAVNPTLTSEKKYDIVSLLIGVNNYYQGRSIDEYKLQFKVLLINSIELANGNKDKVFVITIPDYGYTPFGRSKQATISEGIDRFNAANKHIADSMGVKYFDITPISRNGLSDPELVANDGLHPSGKMYGQWVEIMKEEVIKMINL